MSVVDSERIHLFQSVGVQLELVPLVDDAVYLILLCGRERDFQCFAGVLVAYLYAQFDRLVIQVLAKDEVQFAAAVLFDAEVKILIPVLDNGIFLVFYREADSVS